MTTNRPRSVYAAALLLMIPVAYWIYLAATSVLDQGSDWPGVAGTLAIAALFVALGVALCRRSRTAFCITTFIGVCGFVTQGYAGFRIGAAVYGTSLLLALWFSRRYFGFGFGSRRVQDAAI